jgi:hypothetical protein
MPTRTATAIMATRAMIRGKVELFCIDAAEGATTEVTTAVPHLWQNRAFSSS